MSAIPSHAPTAPRRRRLTSWHRALIGLGVVLLVGITGCEAGSTPASPTVASQATRAPTLVPTTAPTSTPTLAPTSRPAPTATTPPPPTWTTAPSQPQGVNGNPWGYDFNPGNLIYNPPSNFCSAGYFTCISSFWNGKGYVVQCGDGTFSKSGGTTGVCSQHGGYKQTLYSH